MKNKTIHEIKSAGFKTPDHYFESFDAKLKERLVDNDLIKQINGSGFKVPDNYFENLDTKILNQLEENKPVVSLHSKRKFYYLTGIAASLALLLYLYNPSEIITIHDIETASIEHYLEEEDFTSYDLAALLTEDELNKTNFIENEISVSKIEDYLLDTIEIQDLILE
ncbi:hypothetical protein [Psychroserpens mesophilus]|uniref:hypothetical protein n=1 Tax=Psychroserpens mesophilus TaxID=325473 RepID=UPI003D655DC8